VDKPSFEESLRALNAGRRSSGNHPSPEELVAYRAGDLTAEEDDRIQEHLTQCGDCARLLLDLAEFEQLAPPPDELGPVDARAEASWQRLRSRLREEGGEDREPDREAPILRPRPRVPYWRRPALPWALAAGLALCVAGLGWRMGNLERRVDGASQPQLVKQTITLTSESEIRRGGAEDSPVVHPGESVAYDLFLPVDPDIPDYPLYAVEVVSATGGAKPLPAGRESAQDGVLSVVWSAPEPGDYFFEVSGIEGERATPVGRYPFTVHPAR
jgi:hypothetical protein